LLSSGSKVGRAFSADADFFFIVLSSELSIVSPAGGAGKVELLELGSWREACSKLGLVGRVGPGSDIDNNLGIPAFSDGIFCFVFGAPDCARGGAVTGFGDFGVDGSGAPPRRTENASSHFDDPNPSSIMGTSMSWSGLSRLRFIMSRMNFLIQSSAV
jgi:hypothetical protein